MHRMRYHRNRDAALAHQPLSSRRRRFCRALERDDQRGCETGCAEPDSGTEVSLKPRAFLSPPAAPDGDHVSPVTANGADVQTSSRTSSTKLPHP